MPEHGWRERLDSNEAAPPPTDMCSMLSTEGHKYCPRPYWCGCECHLPVNGSHEARWRRKYYTRPDGRRAYRIIHPYDPLRVRVAGVRA